MHDAHRCHDSLAGPRRHGRDVPSRCVPSGAHNREANSAAENTGATYGTRKTSPPPTACGFHGSGCPAWPLVLSPQQYAAPPAVRPQVLEYPALGPLNVTPPATATGTLLSIALLLPSKPAKLEPQQYAAPPLVRPQAS